MQSEKLLDKQTPETRQPGWHYSDSHDLETDVFTEILERVERNVWSQPASYFVMTRIEHKYIPGSRSVIDLVTESFFNPDGTVAETVATDYLADAAMNHPLRRTDIDMLTGRRRVAYLHPERSGVLVATEDASGTTPLRILDQRGYQRYLEHAPAGL